MIGARKTTLIALYNCFKKIGVYWVICNDSGYAPFMGFDDFGLFLYVPMLSYWFGCNILNAAHFFILGMAALSYILMMISFLYISKTLKGLVVTFFLFVFQCKFLLQAYDVYMAYFLAVSVIPLLLAVLKTKKTYWLFGGAFLIGFISAVANLVRGFSALPAVLACLVLGFFSKSFNYKQKIIALFFFALSYSFINGHFLYEQKKSQEFLKTHVENVRIQAPQKGFWHNIYIGLGFIRNHYNIEYSDTSGRLAAQKVDPTIRYGNERYEKMVKELTFDLLMQDRHFVFTSLFAKLGVVFFFFLWCFGWVGLLLSYFYPKPWHEECAFIIGLGVSALPGILTVPVASYLTGFISMTFVYVIYSSLHAFNNGFLDCGEQLYE